MLGLRHDTHKPTTGATCDVMHTGTGSTLSAKLPIASVFLRLPTHERPGNLSCYLDIPWPSCFLSFPKGSTIRC